MNRILSIAIVILLVACGHRAEQSETPDTHDYHDTNTPYATEAKEMRAVQFSNGPSRSSLKLNQEAILVIL